MGPGFCCPFGPGGRVLEALVWEQKGPSRLSLREAAPPASVLERARSSTLVALLSVPSLGPGHQAW